MRRGVVVAVVVVAVQALAGSALAKSSPWPHWNRRARSDLEKACRGLEFDNNAVVDLSLADATRLAPHTATFFQPVLKHQPLRGSQRARFNTLLSNLAAGNTLDATSLCDAAGLAAGIGFDATVTTTTTTTTETKPPQPPPPSPPPPPTSSSCYIDPEGNCYRAGEFCPKALRGQTVQGETGPITCVDNNGWRWEPA
jgi:hypothetical protein